MATVLDPTATDTIDTLADLLDRLGGIPLNRVRMRPVTGFRDRSRYLDRPRREDRLCELVDGVLVEKGMGYRESFLALALGAILRDFVISRNLGLVAGSDGMLKLMPDSCAFPTSRSSLGPESPAASCRGRPFRRWALTWPSKS